MPYIIVRDTNACPASKPWAVKNQKTGDLRGCHPTKEHARQQQKALYVNVPDARPQRSAEPPEDATHIALAGGLMQPRSEGNQNG